MWKTSPDVFSFYAKIGGKSVIPEIVTMPIGENQNLPLTLGFTGNGEGGQNFKLLTLFKTERPTMFFWAINCGGR